MFTTTTSDYYHYFYDPYLCGYDTSFFKTISGSPTAVDGKIRIADARVGSLETFMMGDFEFKIIMPTAPAADLNRIFGLYSLAQGNRNAAFFYIQGTNFYARSYGPDGPEYDQTTIPWEDDWTGAEVSFEIRWRIERVEFWVGIDGDKRLVAKHTSYVPRPRVLPLYLFSGSGDRFDIKSIDIRNVRKNADRS